MSIIPNRAIYQTISTTQIQLMTVAYVLMIRLPKVTTTTSCLRNDDMWFNIQAMRNRTNGVWICPLNNGKARILIGFDY